MFSLTQYVKFAIIWMDYAFIYVWKWLKHSDKDRSIHLVRNELLPAVTSARHALSHDWISHEWNIYIFFTSTKIIWIFSFIICTTTSAKRYISLFFKLSIFSLSLDNEHERRPNKNSAEVDIAPAFGEITTACNVGQAKNGSWCVLARFHSHSHRCCRDMHFNSRLDIKFGQSQWSMKCRSRAPCHSKWLLSVSRTITMQGIILPAITAAEKCTLFLDST